MAVSRLDHRVRPEGLDDFPGKRTQVEPEESLVLHDAVRAAEKIHMGVVDDGAVVRDGAWLVHRLSSLLVDPRHSSKQACPLRLLLAFLVLRLQCRGLDALPAKVLVIAHNLLVITQMRVSALDEAAPRIFDLVKVKHPQVVEGAGADVGACVHEELLVVQEGGVVGAAGRTPGAQDFRPVLTGAHLLGVLLNSDGVRVRVLRRVVIDLSVVHGRLGLRLRRLVLRLVQLRVESLSAPPVQRRRRLTLQSAAGLARVPGPVPLLMLQFHLLLLLITLFHF